MFKVLAQSPEHLLRLVKEWHLLGRFTNSRKWYFFRTVYVVMDLKPVVLHGAFAYTKTFPTLEEALLQFEKDKF